VQLRINGTTKIAGVDQFGSPLETAEEDLDDYLGDGRFFNVQDKLIQGKAKELKTGEAIYNFVTGYLEFDYEALDRQEVPRRGAASLLQKKQKATNLDFVDLFVGLSRAAGIPTRQVFGLAVAEDSRSKPIFVAQPLNSRNLHVWAQIFDPDTAQWVDVDPTWGNTNRALYFNQKLPDRVALWFSSSGTDLDLLRQLTSSQGSLKIGYAEEISQPSPNVTMNIEVSQPAAGFPASLLVRLENKTGLSLTAGVLRLETQGIQVVGDQELMVPSLFPFEKREFRVRITGGQFFADQEGTIKAQLELRNGAKAVPLTASENIKIRPFFSLGTQQALFLALLILFFIGFSVTRFRVSPAK
jgi:hypothetical protein